LSRLPGQETIDDEKCELAIIQSLEVPKGPIFLNLLKKFIIEDEILH